MAARSARRVKTARMTTETTVTLKMSSESLFAALLKQIGDFRLAEHSFDVASDELRVSYDAEGSGRVAVTVVFELDAAQMEQVLRDSRPSQ
jgi:hypothetical protein